MTEKKVTTWTCDRCGKTIEVKEDQPSGWRRLFSADPPKRASAENVGDVCHGCSVDFNLWFRRSSMPRKNFVTLGEDGTRLVVVREDDLRLVLGITEICNPSDYTGKIAGAWRRLESVLEGEEGEEGEEEIEMERVREDEL
jgi:hypothetical protein